MIAFPLAILIAIGSAWCMRLIDRSLTGEDSSPRRAAAIALFAASVWLATLIEMAHWLQVPGASGPVQYWTQADGSVSPLFHVRVLAMFVVMGSMLAALVVIILTIAEVRASRLATRWRLCVVPMVALTAFAIAFFLVGSREFFPTV